jgi:hypothetical protein
VNIEPPSQELGPQRWPERLFRYFLPGYSRIFTEQKLWFSAAKGFNDIFEVFPRLDKLVEQLVKQAEMKEYAFLPPEAPIDFPQYRQATKERRQVIKAQCLESYGEILQSKFSESYGIVCFSEELSLFMWGHYTDCHRGFAVEFNPQHSFFSPRDFGKVVYGRDRPVLTTEACSQMLLHKSQEWSSEKEWRLIKPCGELVAGAYERKGVPTKGFYLPLPMDAIKAVYFGCRTSPGVRDDMLKPLAAFPQIECYVMRRNRIEYKLDAIPWKEWKEPQPFPKDFIDSAWRKAGP